MRSFLSWTVIALFALTVAALHCNREWQCQYCKEQITGPDFVEVTNGSGEFLGWAHKRCDEWMRRATPAE